MIHILHTEKLYLNLLGSLSSIANDSFSLKSEEKKILNNGILVHYVAILVLTTPHLFVCFTLFSFCFLQTEKASEAHDCVDHADDHYKECCIPM